MDANRDSPRRWASAALQALLRRCCLALAREAQENGRAELAQRFIALACGLDRSER